MTLPFRAHFRVPSMLLTAALLSSAAFSLGTVQWPSVAVQEAAAPTPRDETATVVIELITSTTVHSFEGALAILDPFRALASKFHARSRPGVQVLPVTENGTAEFRGIPPGLYQLHLVDALGMPFLDGEDPVFISAVEGASHSYRVESERLHLVEGTVVESSIGDPVAGAVVRVDARAELEAAPRQEILTDEDGVFRVYTARTEVAMIGAADYKSVNVRFGVSQTAGTITLKPMPRRRAVRVTRGPGRTFPPSNLASLSFLPLPAGGTADVEGPERTFIGEDSPKGDAQFSGVRYRRSLLEWPIEPDEGEVRGARWHREFITKRSGGPQKFGLPEVGFRPDALPTTTSFAARWRVECRMLADRRTVLLSNARWNGSESAPALRLPSLPEDAPTPEWTLHCEALAANPDGGSYEVRWRGEDGDPMAPGDTGRLRELTVQDVEGSMFIVFDGDWLSHGRAVSASRGTAAVPAIGGGDLYGSSAAMRGDVVRQRVPAPIGAVPESGDEASAAVSADAAASLRLPSVEAVAAADLRFLHGDSPVRGLTFRVVQKGAVISDEILDLLGETPLVTDASGTVHLRNFVPGEYELRVDASKSLTKLDPGAVVIQLAPGLNGPITVNVP